MGAVVDLREVLEVEMGIDLCRAYVGMAKQFLHAAQVAGRLQHMTGAGMPQQMRMHPFPHTLLLGTQAQALLHRARRQRRTGATGEDRCLRGRAVSGRRAFTPQDG